MSLRHILKSRILWLGGFFVLIGLAALPGVAAAQSTSPSPLLPASPNASLVAIVYWIIFWLAVLVFLLVEGLLIYAVVKFRRKDPDELPVQVYGNTRNELLWTTGSAVIALAIFIVALYALWVDQPPTAEGVSAVSVASLCFDKDVSPQEVAAFLATSTVTIKLTGQQWWWQYDYVDYRTDKNSLVTATDLYVPVGKVVVLQITSRDVVHSWWIPQLGGKQDAYPGILTYTWFQVEKPGTYEGFCTELCGDSHAYMPMRVIALKPEEFDAWAQHQLAGAPAPEAGTLAATGHDLFTTKGCVGCHSINGVATTASVGPNLTDIASRKQIAGSVPYNTQNLRSWLANPLQVKPGAKMPNLGLKPEELDALVAYLDTLK